MSENEDEITRLNPVARAILQGLYDTESPLHKLLGLHYILKAIWKNVVEHWKARIKKPDHYYFTDPQYRGVESRRSYVGFVKAKVNACSC